MIFPRACLILGLATLSLAQLPIDQLFQVDFTTNDEGGCRWVGAPALNLLLKDCVRLGDSFIALIDDCADEESPLNDAACDLLEVYFKPKSLDDYRILQGIYP